jgi:hypothetical protein
VQAIPRRVIDKQEAIRHLIHAAIRFILNREDPFAIHLIVHSADKMIVDVAKSKGEKLRVDWELYIKDEFHTQFFKKHRATYNYLKHAKDDFDKDLPVHDIMMLNIMTLFIATANYQKLFAEQTDHIKLFLLFVMYISPEIINAITPALVDLQKSISAMQYMTPGSFIDTFEENAQVLPQYYPEVSKDLSDIIDFYNLSFSELRAGETKTARTLHLPH